MAKRPPSSTRTTPPPKQGGGVKRPKSPPRRVLEEAGTTSRGDQPSPPLVSIPFSPLSPSPKRDIPGRRSGAERGRDESGHFLPVEEKIRLPDGVKTSEEWLSSCGAQELAFFSKKARSGKDPEFTKEWMKQVMGFQTAKVKGTASVLAAQVGAKGDSQALLAAADMVDSMDESELVAAAGIEDVEVVDVEE